MDKTLADPIVETEGNRGMRMLWPVGAPDADGYQTYAKLSLRHHLAPRYCYSVTLRWTEIKREADSTTEKLWLGKDGLHLEQVAARRFSAGRMRELAGSALQTVRDRYAAGDPEVRAYFEVSS